MAKAQPAKKAAKTVQKKATSAAKTARRTVRCASQRSCHRPGKGGARGSVADNHQDTPSCDLAVVAPS